MTDDIDEIVRSCDAWANELSGPAAAAFALAKDALGRLKAERDNFADSLEISRSIAAEDTARAEQWKDRAETAEQRLNGCRQWLRANANAERSSEARAAFIEAHNAILAIIEDRK